MQSFSNLGVQPECRRIQSLHAKEHVGNPWVAGLWFHAKGMSGRKTPLILRGD